MAVPVTEKIIIMIRKSFTKGFNQKSPIEGIAINLKNLITKIKIIIGLINLLVSPPFKGGVARQQNHLTCRNINGLAGVVDSLF
jgi:hypothetical protein